MKTVIRILMLASITIIGCKKDSANQPSTPASANNDYFPLTAGSSWQYAASNSTTDYEYITADKKDTLGKVYTAAKHIFGYSTFPKYYYRCKINNTYYQLEEGGTTTKLLADNVKANDTWTDSTIISLEHRSYVITKVNDVGLTFTVGSKTYQNVIYYSRTYYSWTYSSSGGYYNPDQYDYYVAKGVGLIQYINDYGDELQLTSCVIK